MPSSGARATAFRPGHAKPSPTAGSVAYVAHRACRTAVPLYRQVRDVLEKLMDDDKDMWDMCLTAKEAEKEEHDAAQAQADLSAIQVGRWLWLHASVLLCVCVCGGVNGGEGGAGRSGGVAGGQGRLRFMT